MKLSGTAPDKNAQSTGFNPQHNLKPGMAAHACDPSPWKMEERQARSSVSSSALKNRTVNRARKARHGGSCLSLSRSRGRCVSLWVWGQPHLMFTSRSARATWSKTLTQEKRGVVRKVIYMFRQEKVPMSHAAKLALGNMKTGVFLHCKTNRQQSKSWSWPHISCSNS